MLFIRIIQSILTYSLFTIYFMNHFLSILLSSVKRNPHFMNSFCHCNIGFLLFPVTSLCFFFFFLLKICQNTMTFYCLVYFIFPNFYLFALNMKPQFCSVFCFTSTLCSFLHEEGIIPVFITIHCGFYPEHISCFLSCLYYDI